MKIRICFVCCIALLLAQLFLPNNADAQRKIDDLRSMWNEGRYAQVLPRLLEYRNGPYGKRAEVDYMIATSYCQTSKFNRAQGYFTWAMGYQGVSENDRTTILEQMQQCRAGSSVHVIHESQVRSSTGIASNRPGVSGKMGYVDESDKSYRATASQPATMVRAIPFDELTRRLFEMSDRAAAEKQLRSRVGTNFQVASFGHFVMASLWSSASQLRDIGAELDRYLEFYTSEYHMPAPPYLITVYVVPGTEDMHNLAMQIHGLDLSPYSIAYSYQNDLSMVGAVLPGANGSLAHELFHLMVRNNFGDIPAWLDEGMASLYEVSKTAGDKIMGIPNWRGAVLQRNWSRRPTVKKLVQMTWGTFDNVEGNEINRDTLTQAANHAMARYFVLYLQDKGELTRVYDLIRKREITDQPDTQMVGILESVLKKSLDEADADFVAWFRSLSR